MSEILVDANGCPVKQEVYRVAKRYGLKAKLVVNSQMHIPVFVMSAKHSVNTWNCQAKAAGDYFHPYANDGQ